MTRRGIATTALAAGALLVVLGSLFPLYGSQEPQPPVTGRGTAPEYATVAITGWELTRDPAPASVPPDDRFPTYGPALVVAAVLAGAGAVLQLRTPRQAAVGRFTAVAGAGLVGGVLWAVLETWSKLFGNPFRFLGEEDPSFVGAGAYVLGAAVVLVAGGAALGAEWPARAAKPTGVSVHRVDDDDTPPFGIAIPVSELDVPPEVPRGAPRDDRDHPTV